MIWLCRDHGDKLNDAKKSVIRWHNHSAILANAALNFSDFKPLRREISTLKESDHDVALLPMVENRMEQEVQCKKLMRMSGICFRNSVI